MKTKDFFHRASVRALVGLTVVLGVLLSANGAYAFGFGFFRALRPCPTFNPVLQNPCAPPATCNPCDPVGPCDPGAWEDNDAAESDEVSLGSGFRPGKIPPDPSKDRWRDYYPPTPPQGWKGAWPPREWFEGFPDGTWKSSKRRLWPPASFHEWRSFCDVYNRKLEPGQIRLNPFEKRRRSPVSEERGYEESDFAEIDAEVDDVDLGPGKSAGRVGGLPRDWPKDLSYPPTEFPPSAWRAPWPPRTFRIWTDWLRRHGDFKPFAASSGDGEEPADDEPTDDELDDESDSADVELGPGSIPSEQASKIDRGDFPWPRDVAYPPISYLPKNWRGVWPPKSWNVWRVYCAKNGIDPRNPSLLPQSK